MNAYTGAKREAVEGTKYRIDILKSPFDRYSGWWTVREVRTVNERELATSCAVESPLDPAHYKVIVVKRTFFGFPLKTAEYYGGEIGGCDG